MELNEQRFIEWFGNYVYTYVNQYKTSAITKDDLVKNLILGFCQSYEMTTMWAKNPSEFTDANEKECIKQWRGFCATCNVTKAFVKVLLTKSYGDLKKELDKKAQEEGRISIYEWLDKLDERLVDRSMNTSSDRPFFSLVVACYNDGRYEKGTYLHRLLNSIVAQGMGRDDIEVILSDDCSPVPYDDIIEEFHDRLFIVTTKTDYNCCPGNTRQKGVDIATGQWLCFADHDDIFYPGAFQAIREFILKNGYDKYVFSPFNGVTPDGQVVRTYDKILGWCHGKFYNLDNFWKPEGIHFIKDLKSHEDIAICTQVAVALDNSNIVPESVYLPFITYAWTDNPQSVSHAKYYVETEDGERNFLEVFFDDYLHATGYIYIDDYKQGLVSRDYGRTSCIQVLCYAYFYTQSFQFLRRDFWPKNLIYAGKLLNVIKETFEIHDNSIIYDIIAANNAAMYFQVRPLADVAGRYVPQQGLQQWLDLIDSYYKQSLSITK